jgi:hypothetical protein
MMEWLFNNLKKLYALKIRIMQQNKWHYKFDCYFYRVNNDEIICVANKQFCFCCPLKIKKIENLDIKEHISLSYGQIRADRAFMISIIAVTISFLSFILK